MSNINKALEIVAKAHSGQTDKGGKAYVNHLLRVSNAGKNENEKICGLLHDLVEDTNWTFEDLKKEGFSDEIISVLECLTKRNSEDYSDFIERIKQNPLAIIVKINDLEDNLNIKRLQKLEDEDFERINKYLKYYHYLKSITL